MTRMILARASFHRRVAAEGIGTTLHSFWEGLMPYDFGFTPLILSPFGQASVEAQLVRRPHLIMSRMPPAVPLSVRPGAGSGIAWRHDR
jgi:hypothetical protein